MVIVVVALVVVLVFCFCRYKLRNNQSGYSKKRSLSSLEDDQDMDNKTGVALEELKLRPGQFILLPYFLSTTVNALAPVAVYI